MIRRPLCGFAIALLCVSTTTRAQAPAPGDEAELQNLLQVLAEETDLATRTRENADYVPGIVSVLGADEARALGARSVLDAIALLPGIEVNRDPNGNATLRVRGIDAFFNSGNVKVLIDGIETSYPVAAVNSSVLLMPLAMVERIEVIRGPGSAVFGDYALNGLVNIVTHKERNGAFAGFGAGGERLAGATLSGDGDWQWQFDLARESSDRYDVPAGAAADEARNYVDLRLAHDGFALKAAGVDHAQRRLDPNGNGISRRERVKALEARYDWRFGTDRGIGAWARWSDADYDFAPVGFIGQRAAVGGDLTWRFGKHLVLAEASAGGLSVERALLPASPPLPPNAPPASGHRPAQVSTHLPSQSLLLQDQYDITPRLTLTGGLRYDRFADVSTRLTPRLAAVWRASESDTLKAQYGEGFRTPVMVELYDSGMRNTDLDFESVRTGELAWVHRRQDSVLRATVFHSIDEGILTPNGPPGAGFGNRGYVRTQGVELEANLRLTQALRLVANASKLATRRKVPAPGVDNPVPVTAFGTPDVLANVGLIAQPDAQWTFGANWNRVGARYATPDRIPGYSAVNLSAEHHFRGAPGLSLRLAVRNANRADVTYTLSRAPPQPPNVLDYGARVWSLELAWRK